MQSCPWCQGMTVTVATSACSACRRVPALHPSKQGGGPTLELLKGPDPLPLLELALPPQPGSASKLNSANKGNPPSKGSLPNNGHSQSKANPPSETDPPTKANPPSETDPPTKGSAPSKGGAPSKGKPPASASVGDLDDDLLSIPLEIDPRPAPPAQLAVDKERFPSALRSTSGAMASRPGQIEDAGGPPMDPFEVAATADFGLAPRRFIDAPSYAWRVWQRRIALRLEIIRLERLRAEAEAARIASLAQIVRTLQAQAAPSAQVSALLRPLAGLDETAAARDAALRGASATYAEAAAQLDGKIAALEADRMKLEELTASAQAGLDRCNEARARAEAKCKRVEIALRAAHEAARVAGGPNAKLVPPEIVPRIVALEEEKTVRAAELKPLTGACSDAEMHVREREAPVREVRHRIASLREERRQIEQTSARQLAVRSEGVQEVERERLLASANVAGQILAVCPDAVPDAERARAAEMEQRVASCAHDLAKHVRALGSADPVAVKRGAIGIGMAASLLLLLLFYIVRAVIR